MEYKYTFRDDTTCEEFDRQMKRMYQQKRNMRLYLDISKCSIVNMSNIISLKPILDRHRESSRKWLECTTIRVQNRVTAAFIKCILPFIKNEKPVYIQVK